MDWSEDENSLLKIAHQEDRDDDDVYPVVRDLAERICEDHRFRDLWKFGPGRIENRVKSIKRHNRDFFQLVHGVEREDIFA
jgi:hypothetical protein